jgi:Tol biopolymer transport system component
MHAVLAIATLIVVLAVQQPVAPSPPPATDIYELSFTGSVDSLARALPRPVATERGYDNQPSYTLDGAFILFTANRDGKQTDIYEFDRSSRRIRQLVATAEAEYSPTIVPGGDGFSVIRVEADGTQRLWRFDRSGANPRIVLQDIKPVGYHAWIDGDALVLFVLGKPPTLQRARLSTGTGEVVARDIGRSLQRIPGGRSVSFVQREADGTFWVKSFDAAGGAITAIAPVAPGSTDRDCAWLPDGTLLMSSGTRIFARLAGTGGDPTKGEWREVFDAAAHQLGAVSRMAVAPDGKAIAIVAQEPH